MQESPELTQQLADVLKKIQRPGDFYVHGTLRTPSPALEVAGVGPVAFPLLPVQAEQLRALAEAAPYGRGDQTLVDAQVRRTWQLPPDRIHLEDPDFEQVVHQIVDRVRTGLGVKGEVRAELYKMLIYDEGSFFVPHRDTEKVKGMFATLVIVLPSVFSGGELVVRHAGREATLPLTASRPGDLSFAAFYADCEHEIRPVTKGYRMALVYNLVLERGKPPRAPELAPEEAQVTSLLRDWVASDAEPAKVLYVLEHRYSSSGLSWAGLKNGDAGAASVLKVAAEQAGCTVSLAMISIEESGAAEYTGGYRRRGGWGRSYADDDDPSNYSEIEVTDRSEAVGEWRDTNDQPMLLEPLSFEPDEISPPEALEDATPDEQSFSEATGNEGASFEKTYRFASLVLWPRDRFIQILSQADLKVAISRIEHWVKEAGRDRQATANGLELAGYLVAQWEAGSSPEGRTGVSRTEVARMMTALMDLDAPPLLERVIALASLSDREAEKLNEGLARALITLGWKRSGPLLARIITEGSAKSFEACVDLFSRLASSEPDASPGGLEALNKTADTLAAGLPPAERSGTDWSRSVLSAPILTKLLGALHRIGADHALQEVNRRLIGPPAYKIDEMLLPPLLELPKQVRNNAALEGVQALVREHLEARIAKPLEPPPDQRRDAKLSCKCADCTALSAFLQSPTQAQWELKAIQHRRSHVEATIKQARSDLECQTVTRGSPHTLVCVKTTASYKRRCAQRAQDLKAMAALDAG